VTDKLAEGFTEADNDLQVAVNCRSGNAVGLD